MTRVVLEQVIGGERRAERATRIARRRLDPYSRETAVAQHLAVGDAVKRDAAREAEVRHAGLVGERSGHAQNGFFEHDLNRSGEIHLALCQWRVWRSWRTTEQSVELLVRHRQTGTVVEVRHVEAERTVRPEIDEIVENRLRIGRLAIGRQTHYLVFARIHPETGVIGECGIQQSERMREVYFLDDFEMVAAADGGRRRRPFADAVHRQYHRLFERRWIECARRVALVVLGEEQALFPIEFGRQAPQLIAQ